MWNDTDIPLAHLITFRCYGTWLHGDNRGSIDRFHNQYKSPYIPSNKDWSRYNKEILKGRPLLLNADQRTAVECAVRETCLHRKWHLHVINVRTNHAHVVVSIGGLKPERALSAFKANATREMRSRNQWRLAHSPWAAKGSTRYLWNERSVAQAIDYVLHGQGNELPEFE